MPGPRRSRNQPDRRIQEGWSRNQQRLVGACHAKAILSGTWLLSGSTNWTTSSRCNMERSTLVHLTPHEARMQNRAAEEDWAASEEFTQELRRREEDRQEAERGEFPRSRSEPAPSRAGFGD
ncbi:unnamed protein product [Polarella glacialis]|uniref:Phospholipase D-like domain-containing protein n=1 Tax=Polarella glacialis TaxID=89957 RepID=A0A813E542_POLGL|nr:unnamed protein product [Polarella glacialis]